MSDSLQQCQTFLAAIFEPDDVIEIRCLKPAVKHWCTPADFADLHPQLLRHNSSGKHVYFGGSPRKAAGGSKEEDVALARCVFADFDGGTTADEAWSRIEAAGLPRPTATINSGGGIHAWWRLAETMTDARQWSGIQKGLAAALGSDASIHDWPRIMRLPGFVNHKYPSKPAAALIEVDASRVYPLATLTPFLKPMSQATRAFIAESVITDGGRRETMFRAACDLRDHGWTPDAAEAVLMPRMETFADLSSEDITDCPRQIRNAWKRDPRPASTATARPTARRKPPVPPWRPFPVDALPEPLAAFVAETATAIGCDETYVALPLLTATGAAIGTTHRLQLKPGFAAPAVLWTAIVGESGTSKTPALSAALEHVRDRESELRRQNREDEAEHEAEVTIFEAAMAAWKKASAAGKADSEPPARPMPPAARRALAVDSTVEALAPILADNPRGILLARDELAGWLASMDRYAKGGSGGDEPFYLSAYNGLPHTVDRRTGSRTAIHVEQAALWICGGIQPGVLRRHIGSGQRESGLLARLLLAAPPPRPKAWSEATVATLTIERLHRMLDCLYRLEPEIDEHDRQRPRLVRLSREAKRLWIDFYDQHNLETASHTGDLAAAWSKLEETAARLALVCHLVKLAAYDPLTDAAEPDAELQPETLAAAIRLVAWLKDETKRVYRLLDESDEEQRLRQIDDKAEELIRRKGGSAYPRDLISGLRVIPDTETAEATLTRLVAAGRGRWHNVRPTDTGGRPARRFELMPSAEPTELPEFSSCACADSSEEPETEYVEL